MRLPLFFAIAASVLMPLSAADVRLEAGLARVEITPSGSMEMYGYRNRKCGPSSGTHDPLWAKVLILATGESKLAIVTMDLGSMVSPKLRDDIRAKLGIPVVLLAASHTHSGPRFLPPEDQPEAEPSPYLREVEEKIFGAVEQASKALFPAKLATGRGSIQLGYNRLLPREDGRSRALFDNLERVPYGPVDPEFMLLRVEDLEGKARALLVHYAVHAVVLGPTNCKYSADYPGAMQSKVEAEIPGVQCMFVQGATGDINPLFMARTGKEDEDFTTVKKMGELLAGEILKASKTMQPVEVREPIRHTSDSLGFADRWDASRKVEAGISTVLIGRDIAIAATPGEPLLKLQTTWKEQAEVAFPLFYGYTWSSGGGWPGYIPDIRSAAHGGYGADNTTRIEVGAGERIIQQHLIRLYEMQGMWKDQPGKP